MNKLTNLLLAALLMAPLAALHAAASSSLAADLRLPCFFGDHMVLQRDKPVSILGRDY